MSDIRLAASAAEWNSRAVAAKTDSRAFDRLAEDASFMIRRAAARAVHHFITDSDEEWSVALLAFYEAVQSYREEMGSFPGFACLVIRRRLIDWGKRNRAAQQEILLPPETMDSRTEEEAVSRLDVEIGERAAERSAAESPEGTPLRDEIEALGQQLEAYGFSFFDLPACSPRAGKTKEACGRAVRTMLERNDLTDRMARTGTLPMKDLQKASGVSGKILERHRRYIITAVLILRGDYPGLSEYLRQIRTGKNEPGAAFTAGSREAVLYGLLLLLAV